LSDNSFLVVEEWFHLFDLGLIILRSMPQAIRKTRRKCKVMIEVLDE